MCDRSKRFQWTILLIVSSAISLCNGNDYCEHYANCQQHLEIEERHCVKLGGKLNHVGTHCMEHVDVARTAVDGLLLRKTEIERDCIKKSDGGQPWNLKQFKRASCKRAIQRFPKLLTDQFIDKSSITKIGQYDDIKACRKSARLLRKQCHTLGQCCPLDSCSGLGTIQSQLSSAITFLHRLRLKCLEQKNRY